MKRQGETIVVWIGLSMLILAGCFSGGPEELTRDQVISKGYLVLLPDPGTSYSFLKPHWFEKGDSACIWLSTFFLDQNQRRVAMMAEEPTCGSSSGETYTKRPISIRWATGSAYFCKPDLRTIPLDNFEGDRYQTCLVWSKDKTYFMI